MGRKKKGWSQEDKVWVKMKAEVSLTLWGLDSAVKIKKLLENG